MVTNPIKNLALSILAHAILFLALSCSNDAPKEELPNILWLTSEDNSPFLGCYGDSFATTPHLDKLASEGFLYTNAYANAPVCAPARNTIITGVYACSAGNQHMRSRRPKSDKVAMYPQLLREAGYYCTNNSKTDYNLSSTELDSLWDECSREAHYKNRPEGKPFFAIFNTLISHESCIHKSIPNNELRHDPKKVPIAPYHPRTPEMEHDWAQYYDKVEDMDTWVGEKLQELEDAGLAENTIVFYYADHGGILGRSKRFLYETGTHVPFIVRIPDKYKHLFPSSAPGAKVDRIVSFVDLAPTLLSIAGAPIPDFLQGDAFLGDQKTSEPEYAYMFRGRMDERYDMMRAVRDKKFRYIRNYIPYRPYGQHLWYLWKAPSMQSWDSEYQNGNCNETQSRFFHTKPVEELYDTENDPWEINNLANNPEYVEVLDRMRKASIDWSINIKDAGFLPEEELFEKCNTIAPYDYCRSGDIDIETIIPVANLALEINMKNIDSLCNYAKSKIPAIRYWAVSGLLLLENKAQNCTEILEKLCSDPSASVRLIASEALYNLGGTNRAKQTLLSTLQEADAYTQTHALNVIDHLNIGGDEFMEIIRPLASNKSKENGRNYAARMAEHLLNKWSVAL